MRLDSQCILCLLKRHSETAAKYGDEAQVTAFTRDLMHMICAGPVEMSAPFYTPGITKLFTEHFGLADDRFAEEKEASNRYALERFDRLTQMVRTAADPLYAGLQGAILGNYIDFSALQGEVSFEKLDEMLSLLHTIEVDRDTFEALRADLGNGRELLYLTDNAGEIVFDRVFLEVIRDTFPNLSITVCVRGGPAQNDATRADAQAIGMPFRVIDNGTRIPGTVLELASQELKAALSTADVILAKGQANVETLLDTDHGYNVYYAFLVKCKRFIDRFGKEKLTPMLVHDHK
ncbi:MAG: DUF89 family protein [Oscillospiraceae bacterium]|nr:DUF89 family protein [Oscillospiraceae bacterium]